jgi:hypothetical protein
MCRDAVPIRETKSHTLRYSTLGMGSYCSISISHPREQQESEECLFGSCNFYSQVRSPFLQKPIEALNRQRTEKKYIIDIIETLKHPISHHEKKQSSYATVESSP